MIAAEKLSGRHLQINPGPWDIEDDFKIEQSPIQLIPPLVLARRLELLHPAFSDETLESIGDSEWCVVNNGKYFIEVRNPDIRDKLRGSVDIIDYDDTIFNSTGWHKKEYKLIENSQELHARGIQINEPEARELYQQSKILIPGKADFEPRYTPLLNLLLLTQFANKLERGMDRNNAWNEVLKEKDNAVHLASRNEQYLSVFQHDPDIVNIFANNSPSGFKYDRLIELIFRNPIMSSDLKIIATRGKIEGPLGQVYKLHSSVMDQNVDLVLYSNDLKAKAILFLTRLFPEFKHMAIRVLDDNPNEILPYRELARSRGIENIKLTHVRHPEAKRKDDIVPGGEKPDYTAYDPISGAYFDHYFPKGHLYSVF